jgi:hypothetical protein
MRTYAYMRADADHQATRQVAGSCSGMRDEDPRGDLTVRSSNVPKSVNIGPKTAPGESSEGRFTC